MTSYNISFLHVPSWKDSEFPSSLFDIFWFAFLEHFSVVATAIDIPRRPTVLHMMMIKFKRFLLSPNRPALENRLGTDPEEIKMMNQTLNSTIFLKINGPVKLNRFIF